MIILFCSLALFIGIEFCWNVYPSTPLSSLMLLVCHVIVLGGLWCAPSEYPYYICNKKTKKGDWNPFFLHLHLHLLICDLSYFSRIQGFIKILMISFVTSNELQAFIRELSPKRGKPFFSWCVAEGTYSFVNRLISGCRKGKTWNMRTIEN